jgi:thiamine-phosphate pyrophosphorylase
MKLQLAQDILALHAAQLQTGTPLPLSDCTHPDDAAHGEAAASVLAACRSMGFVEADAQLLARAWMAQAKRTGRFDPAAWPATPEDFGVDTGPRADAFAPCPQRLGLYAVLPDADWVGRMARAGVPTVQLRFKSEDRTAVAREVQAAVRAVQGTGSLLFINDHWREAIDAGAYGVHLGQEDLEGAREHLQTIRTAGLRLGLSTHGYAELLRAESVAPSYLALGAIYPTTLKRMATAPQGPGRLAAYARLMRHRPLVAIGGIDFARLAEVLPSGIGSVAVVRALVAAADPTAEAQRFMARIAQGQKSL